MNASDQQAALAILAGATGRTWTTLEQAIAHAECEGRQYADMAYAELKERAPRDPDAEWEHFVTGETLEPMVGEDDWSELPEAVRAELVAAAKTGFDRQWEDRDDEYNTPEHREA